MTPSRKLPSLTTLSAWIMLALAATMLSACRDNNDNSQLAAPMAATSASSWERLGNSDAHSAERAYRACAREAALLHLPVVEFPETSERITYVTEDGKRLRKSEHLTVDIDHMQIDNGCATQIVRSVSVDVLIGEARGANRAGEAFTVDETGRTVPRAKETQTLQGNGAVVQLAISRASLPPRGCTFTRDPGPQSHFMMLSLCRNEERHAEETRREEQAIPPGKLATRDRSS